jgi:predicted MFS family arabinose efflux permease
LNAAAPPQAFARQTFVLLALAASITGVTQRVVEPMLPRLAEEFAVGVPAAAWVLTAFALAATGAQYFHGPLGDRFGKLRIVTWLMALSSIASVGCALSASLTAMMAWRFAAGLFGSGAMTLGMAHLADVVPRDERQPVLGRFIAGSISGQAVGPFVGGLLTDLVGWRWTFVLLAVSFAAVSAVLFSGTRAQWNKGPRSASAWMPPGRYLRIAARPEARRVLLLVLAEMFFFYGAFSFIGPMLHERFDLAFTLIGLVLAGFGIGGLLYSASVRVLLSRLGQRGCVLLGGLLGGLLFLAAAITPVWPLAILCTIGLGFSFYSVHNTLQTKASEMAPEARASGISLFSMAWAGGQAIGVAVMSAGIGLAGYAPMIALYGLGFAVVGLTVRRMLQRL